MIQSRELKKIMYENDWEIFVRFVDNLIPPWERMQMATFNELRNKVVQVSGPLSATVDRRTKKHTTSLKKRTEKKKKWNETWPNECKNLTL